MKRILESFMTGFLALSFVLPTKPVITKAALEPVKGIVECSQAAVKRHETSENAPNFDFNEFIDYLTANFENAAERAINDRGRITERSEDTGSSEDIYASNDTISEDVVESVGTDEQESFGDQAGIEEAESEESLIYAGEWTITFYCQCEKCCGRWAWSNSTASGREPIPWYTVAAGESFPFGTVLYIEGFGYMEVMDRGVPDGWADIYVSSHGEIPSYGMTTRSVYIVN